MHRKLTLRYLYPDKSLQNPYWGTKVFLVQTHTGSKRTQELLFEAVTAALRPLRQIFLHQIKWKSDKSSKIYSKLLKYKKCTFQFCLFLIILNFRIWWRYSSSVHWEASRTIDLLKVYSTWITKALGLVLRWILWGSLTEFFSQIHIIHMLTKWPSFFLQKIITLSK